MKYFFILFALYSCASRSPDPDNLVVVHDAHFDERSMAALDRYLGGKAIAVSLPTTSKLGNPEVYFKKLTLHHYAEAVCHKVAALQGSIVLIGHGFGGAVINEAYGICPKRVIKMIYLSAVIPFPGEKPYELGTEQDTEFYNKAVEEDEETGLLRIRDWYNFTNAYCQDADEHQREYIKSIAGPEPIAPRNSILSFNVEKFQDVEKLVVITTTDDLLSPQTQKRYTLRLQNTEIKSVNADHMAPITHTDEVGEMIQNFIKGN